MTSRRTVLTAAAAGLLAASGASAAFAARAADGGSRFVAQGGVIVDSGRAVGRASSPTEAQYLVQLLNSAVATGPGGPPVFPRPSGPGYVRYEDLARPGDTLSQALRRCPPGLIVTFGPGNYDITDFADRDRSGLFVPKSCAGIWGSGPGTLAGTAGDGSDGTYFRMVAGSSTLPTSAVRATVLRTTNAAVPQSFGQFAVVGSAQPHAFSGFSARQGAGRIDLTDVSVYGHQGYANHPDGETFGVNIDWYPDHSLTRVEGDGRRADGARYGTSPLTAQHCRAGTWVDCHGHHALAGMPTFYEASGIVTRNLRSEYNGTGSGSLSGHCLNHERTTGIVHHSPRLVLDRTNGNTGLHINHSNDGYDPAETRCADWTDGTLTVLDPVWSDAFGNGLLYAMTSATEMGSPSTQRTPPVITIGDAALQYLWCGLDGHVLV